MQSGYKLTVFTDQITETIPHDTRSMQTIKLTPSQIEAVGKTWAERVGLQFSESHSLKPLKPVKGCV